MTTLDPILLALNEPVFEIDAKGLLHASTPALREMLGIHASERSNLLDAFVDEDRKRVAQALKRIFEGKAESAVIEARIPSDDGMGSAVEVKLVPLCEEGKKATSVYGWMHDVSALQQSERTATVQGTHLFNLVENVDDACLVESAEGLVETLNAAFCQLFGVNAAPQSLIGIDVADVFEQARAASGCKDGPVLAIGDGVALSEYPVHGEKVSQRAFPIVNEGMPLGRLYLFKTGAKTAALAAAHQTTAAQLELVEHIARELATTVESAGSAIHRAEQLELPASVVEHFRRVEISARTAFTAIGGLLDFSKFEPTEIKSLRLDSQEFHLRETLSLLLEHLAEVAEDQDLALRIRVEQDVPDLVTGDAARLTLVLRNLMESLVAAVDGNADPGLGEVRLAIAPEYMTGDQIHLRFSVEASAGNKAAKLWPHLPVSLMQIAVARQLITVMGGTLETLKRRTANGFEFALAFPWNGKKEERVRPNFVTLTGMAVMIVSADPAHRNELATLARGWRMLPQEADNATMAIQLLLRLEREGNPIPLVIVSSDLPLQDGFLLAFRIKSHHKLRQTLVMMLAKSGRPGDAIACRENGISAYLRYPVSPTQLNEAILAVTGVSDRDDSDVTHTLITRHSLREARRATLLLIDGDRDAQLAATNIVRRRGYRLTVAEDADQAIDALEQEIYDIVLVDPRVPGLEDAARSLRSIDLKNAASIVIIAASEDASEAHRKRCEVAGFDGFLAKPFKRDAMLALLEAKTPVREAGD